MAGIDAAATAVSLLSFAVQSFQGCVQAFEFFETAQHIGPDGDLLRVGLEFERYRLIRWSERVELGQAEKPAVNWHLAKALLEQLFCLLTSAERLKGRYSLHVADEVAMTAEEGRRVSQEPKQGMRKLIDRLQPTISTTTGQIIQNNNSAVKKLRWATRDKNKLKQYLEDIKLYVDNLELLLDQAERDSERTNYNRFLRDLVSLSPGALEVGQIEQLVGQGTHRSDVSEEAIKAAAYVKQVRLVLSADKREDEQTPSFKGAPAFMPTLMKLKYKYLRPRPGTELRHMDIELALYQDELVLVQWKVTEGIDGEKYATQTKCLAVLLMSLSHESFRSLPCVGSLSKRDLSLHAVVFSIPPSLPRPKITTLKQLIASVRYVCLSRRLSIGRSIAEAVLQLHTSGWMHKSLRPENVVFLTQDEATTEAILDTEPFLVGYDYARADSPDSAQAFTQVPNDRLTEELYRHPQARGLQRETYQKRFDMYAIACILVELVAWEPLVKLHSKYTILDLDSNLDAAEKANTVTQVPSLMDLLDKADAKAILSHQGGPKVLEAVRRCMAMERLSGMEDASLEVQAHVVDILAWCRI